MKKIIGVFGVILLIVAGCGGEKQAQAELACIDLTKNYPEKEFFLTDMADITFLYLNSDNDEYLYQGSINYITANTVVVVDNSSGSILFFNKDGIPRSRFNHVGNGPEDYLPRPNVMYDETTDELFVTSAGYHLIQVYSSTGEHKRTITIPQHLRINGIISLDDSSFFFNELGAIGEEYISFYRISKTTGAVIDSVQLPKTQTFLGINLDGNRIPTPTRRLVKCPDGALLSSHGTDTVFLYSSDKSLTPVLYQTPSVTSLSPMEFLDNCLNIGQYQFVKCIIVKQGDVYPGRFPAKFYIREKKTGNIFRQKLLLPDYKGKEFIINPGTQVFNESIQGNGDYFELDLIELKKAYRENMLSGKLKELVATLNEDKDNNVFMLLNFK